MSAFADMAKTNIIHLCIIKVSIRSDRCVYTKPIHHSPM